MQSAASNPRHSANASVHRTMNERRRSAGPRFLANSITCECECNRAECGHNIEISITDYEAVRALGRRFIVAPDHQTQDELMICAGRGYSVIEKTGDPGLLAQALDPR